jgi:phosphohistidine phosphatase
MRRLLLLRHAKSDWTVAGQRDADRTLAARGREVAPIMGSYMARHGLEPDRVMVSEARRARETWELVAPALRRTPSVSYEPRLYEASMKALLSLVHETPAAIHTLMLIGHNPGLQELAAKLMATGDIDARQQLLEKFPTAALAVLDFPIDHWDAVQPSSGRLDRFVMPRALKLDVE